MRITTDDTKITLIKFYKETNRFFVRRYVLIYAPLVVVWYIKLTVDFS